ncbi:hypothetical protein AK812_SmicGene34126 [Symbiodinium microadriaticum]|uniref:Uncharacterized protein n=1 Tax=Symbiodinium microadriaticum TaxID=2951 RepID=A0A1Q9CPT1_SYMMI|nr:hypothetical protein AK812_SmicGene34126 [Symbiodinium microadriaticum]
MRVRQLEVADMPLSACALLRSQAGPHAGASDMESVCVGKGWFGGRLAPLTYYSSSEHEALSSHPNGVSLALHSLASFEMPRTVAQYTALLDVPALSWKLQLGRSGGGKCLLITFMKEATLIEDKDKCSGQGDELGIDKRFDASLPPPQFNKLPDFPADLDETAVHGYAAECMHAVWMHLDSEAVRDLQETFSGLVRIPVGQGNQAFFEEWYDPLVAVQEDAMQPPSSSCGTLTVAPASHMRRSTLPCCPGSPKHRSLCLRLPCSAICVAPAEVLPPAPQDSQPRSHVCSSTMPTPPKHSAASRSC